MKTLPEFNRVIYPTSIPMDDERVNEISQKMTIPHVRRFKEMKYTF